MSKPRGRPRLPEGERLAASIQVRLRTSEYRALVGRAKRVDMKPAAWARQAILRALGLDRAAAS